MIVDCISQVRRTVALFLDHSTNWIWYSKITCWPCTAWQLRNSSDRSSTSFKNGNARCTRSPKFWKCGWTFSESGCISKASSWAATFAFSCRTKRKDSMISIRPSKKLWLTRRNDSTFWNVAWFMVFKRNRSLSQLWKFFKIYNI